MDTTYDRFIRTTDPDHMKVVSHIFNKLHDQGDIYKGEYSGWYCTPCETSFTESQLVDGKCPVCGAEVKKTREEAYFFAVTKYQKRLEQYFEDHPGFIEPEARKKEMVNNFLKPGLTDLCVSRTSFTWGIPVEFDPKHVIYVWIDALSNYITALGYDVDSKGELYKKYWPCDVHIIGKDILRFHTIYWPIILMALGEPLPEKIFGHPWLLNGFDKMSKSKGNTIYADELADLFGVDAVRFYLLSAMPYLNDGTVTYEAVIKLFNTELANNLGNLVSRTCGMTKKYFSSVVPERGELTDLDRELLSAAENGARMAAEKLDQFRTSEALEAITDVLHRANKYVDETEPWVLARTEEGKKRLETVIYNLLDVIRLCAVDLKPFIPQTSEKILSVFSLSADEWSEKTGELSSGITLADCPVLFARIDEEKTLAEIAAAHAKKDGEKPAPAALPEITIDDFMKIELRCAEVKACEKLAKSKKLLKLSVDAGDQEKQVLSGIAEFYSPEDLIGKKIVLVSNLKKARLCGEESCGMILAGGEDDVKVVFLDPSVPNGTRIR